MGNACGCSDNIDKSNELSVENHSRGFVATNDLKFLQENVHLVIRV